MRLTLVLFAAACALAAYALAPRTPAPVTFALVAYRADAGALLSDTLDSGLSPDDCAFALGAAARLPDAAGEVLITCEPETPR